MNRACGILTAAACGAIWVACNPGGDSSPRGDAGSREGSSSGSAGAPACAAGTVACGDGCIPPNAVCCDDGSRTTSSYCTNAAGGGCSDNLAGRCSAAFPLNTAADFCCAPNGTFGSNDCPVGQHHCGLLCWPLDHDCTAGGADAAPSDDAPDGSSFTLTVDLVGAWSGEFVTSSDGSVTCSGGPVPCSASYPAGTQVTLTANVNDRGFTFGGWSGGGCAGTGDCVTTLNGDQHVTALFHATLKYTDSADFTVPAGISAVGVQLWGGGGQGAFVGSFNSGLGCYTGTGGGGGGAYNTQMLTVTPANSYHLTIGCGGCVTSTDSKQYNLGGNTSFGSLLSAGGGQGGYDSPPNGGAGGTCGGPGCASGSNGDNGSTSSCKGGNGGNAGGPSGGAGGVYGASAGDGAVPGGGGAGSEGIAGGIGGSGQAIVTW